jgi:membrane-associated phospholipid phosphatase
MSSSNAHLIDRLRVHWWTKLWLGSLLTIVFCAGYFLIGYHPVRSPVRLALTTIDRSVPFSPGWVWVYQSIYLLLLAAWLSETADELRRYAIGFAILMLAGFSCFLLWPVAGPRPEEMSNDPMYRVLVRYDTTLNSFPSLHMALATYSASTAVAVTSASLRRLLAVLLPVWVAIIGYATLATKQHYWVDLPPGILLGLLAQYLAWRYRRVITQLPACVDKRAA